MTVKRGDIYYADLSPVIGSEQGGMRPVLIVQNDVGNKYSPTVIAAAITSQKDKSNLPTHIKLETDNCGLSKESIVLLEQIRTIDKNRAKTRDMISHSKWGHRGTYHLIINTSDWNIKDLAPSIAQIAENWFDKSDI